MQIGWRARGDEHREEHARERGVQAGLVQEEPEADAAHRVRQHRVHTGPIEQYEEQGERTGGDETRDVDRRRVEERDDGDCHDVVDDDRCRQEHAQFDRHPGAKQYDERDGERCIGADGDAPRVSQVRRGKGCVDERRQHDPAKGGEHRQRAGAQRRKMARGELALDLEADDEEEDGQQSMVHPMAQRIREAISAPSETERRLPPVGERGGER